MPRLRRHRGNIHRLYWRSSCLVGVAGCRRNPGKMDGVSWNSSKVFICPAAVDGNYDEDTDSEDDEIIDGAVENLTPVEIVPSEPMTISILKIARPTRLKGIAKEFEVVRSPDRVIVLEEEDDGLYEDWEHVCVGEVKQKRTYSAVLTAS